MQPDNVNIWFLLHLYVGFNVYLLPNIQIYSGRERCFIGNMYRTIYSLILCNTSFIESNVFLLQMLHLNLENCKQYQRSKDSKNKEK